MTFQLSTTSIDQNAVSTLLADVTSAKIVNQMDTLGAAFSLIYYGAQFVLGQPTPPVVIPTTVALKSNLASSLTQLKGKGATAGVSAINWAQLITELLQFLPALLPFLTPFLTPNPTPAP